MHTEYRHILAAALLTLLAAAAGSSAEEAGGFDAVSKEARELLDALGNYSAEQRDEAVEATRSALDDVDRSIDSLEDTMHEQWDNMDETAREKARVTMRALRQERRELAEWYGGMKSSSGGAWDEMKRGFADAYESLGDAWNRARSEFDSDSE